MCGIAIPHVLVRQDEILNSSEKSNAALSAEYDELLLAVTSSDKFSSRLREDFQKVDLVNLILEQT